jgi:membrane protease YdiL (CAAX protease family)
MFSAQKKVLWLMAILTLFGFPLLAWPLLWLQDISWDDLMAIEYNEISYLLVMLSIGLFFGLTIILLTEIPYFDKALSHIKNRLANLELTNFFVVLLSIAAGVGEELFFRGALQPFLGIYLTSLIFVAIHGYFSFRKWAVNFFGLLLFIFICFIGWMAEQYSIWHAIAAHFSYDLVLLFYYKKMQQT